MARPETPEAAEAHIKAIRKANGFDAEPGVAGSIIHALDKSLSIISEELYQKSSRFLMEILQNADDCFYDDPTPTMELTYRNGRLRIDYNEVGFTRHDVEALCSISSTKLKSMNQTGEKGIGFKSVFKMSHQAQVLSGHYSFAFDAKRKLGTITPEWVVNAAKRRPGFTSILLHIQEELKQDELILELKSMGHKHLVFLRRLQRINITIDDNQGKTWETKLHREDKDSAGGYRRIITSSHDSQTLEYWIYPHIVKTLPPEPKRQHYTESAILLAFPVRGGASPEPVVEQQDTYAVHPIKDYGFKFLVNADFLLVASRQDIDASSKWNVKLRTSIWDAFQGALKHLSVGPLRHTWPRYISIPLNLSGFFWTLGYDMRQRLREIPVVETAKGEIVTPLLARYVPPPLRDQDNTPLTLGPLTESRYLSKQYSDSDWRFLQNLHVQKLSDEDFLDDIRQLLSQGNCAAEKPELWHVQIAKVLMGLYRDKNKIKELPLIPVNGGEWVPASTDNIFFRNSEEHTALGDLGVFFVDQDAAQNDDRKALFKMLDIVELSSSSLQSLILKKHSETRRSLLPAAHILVSHAVFLFRSRWQSGLFSIKRTPFWVVTTTGDFLQAHQVYLKGEWAYYADPCYTEFRREFPLLHEDYDSAVKPEEMSDWISWLCKQLGVQNVSKMTPTLQNLVVKKHSKADPTDLPTQDLMISHAKFLFQTEWISKDPPPPFYVVTEVGAYVQAKDVYLDTSTQQSFGKYFEDFRQRCQFLHKKYYSAVKPEDKKRWLKWLHENIGVQDTSRLVPKLAELTYRECSESNQAQLPTGGVLISHTVFLFRAKWKKPEPNGDKFWVFTEAGQHMPAHQVYLGTAQQPSTREWYKRFRKEHHFLHVDYYNAVKPEETNSWLTWLCGQLGLWEVPRLVDPSNPGILASDFRQILDSWPSKEFLMLLKDEWSSYERFLDGQIVESDQNGTDKVLVYPHSTGLRDQIGSAKVKCRDGLNYPLHDTFTISFLPSGTDASILSLHPLLEIPESQSADWTFLETFGVTMKESVAMYLKTLDQVRGSVVSLNFISWLYGQIQEKDGKEPGDLTYVLWSPPFTR
ncbi:unnamed protein product [Clonostachys rosea f. rosea IK726]|uniref:Uncharacterized protein n=1 Tax=Clonostachys rosea f. rosea IK726 TaxID=1349383 RepID=A0ACA9TJJ0_BIOOC|nr:unnamed protein product [Clonostachys rosea f. rosea IK726]